MTIACGPLPVLQPDTDEAPYELSDYEGARARWCPGCGDHSILTAVEKLLTAEQLAPEQTVFVSGIGCSSRFPHYLKTYGFHGIHGRALPVATGIKLTRPDLTVLLLDNGIYALTKKQTSPTTPQGFPSNTQPGGSWLPALDPLSVALGVTNASFVAQTAEWIPAHLAATLRTAYHHRGLSFVRILQRCPVYSPEVYQAAVQDPSRIALLTHDDGVPITGLEKAYSTRVAHDPSDLAAARQVAGATDHIHLGLLFRDPSHPRYEEIRRVAPRTAEERLTRLGAELDRYAV